MSRTGRMVLNEVFLVDLKWCEHDNVSTAFSQFCFAAAAVLCCHHHCPSCTCVSGRRKSHHKLKIWNIGKLPMQLTNQFQGQRMKTQGQHHKDSLDRKCLELQNRTPLVYHINYVKRHKRSTLKIQQHVRQISSSQLTKQMCVRPFHQLISD